MKRWIAPVSALVVIGACAVEPVSPPTGPPDELRSVEEAPPEERSPRTSPPSTVGRADHPPSGAPRRLTVESDRGGWASHMYSQLLAMSIDDRLVLVHESTAGGYVVRRLEDGSRVPVDTDRWVVPRWHPTAASVIVHADSNDDEVLRIQATDVTTATTRTLFVFPAAYERILVDQSFDELSRDGRWLAGAARRNDGAMVVFALDLTAGALTIELPLPDLYDSVCSPDPEWGEVEPDWVGVSPLGRYLIVQWVRDGSARCSGLEAFDLTTGTFAGRVTEGHAHGDLALDGDGGEMFVTVALASVTDTNRPALVAHTVPEGDRREIRPVDWGDGEHVSCQGPAGACVVTSTATDGDHHASIWLAGLAGTAQTITSHGSSSCGYWVQPRATVSRRGGHVVFASDRSGGGPSSCASSGDALGRGDVWLVDLAAAGVVWPASGP